MIATPTESTDEEARAFLRHRVGRFGLLVGSLFVTFAAFRLFVVLTFLDGKERVLEPSMLWHLAATASFLGIWVACRVGPGSTAYVRTVEHIGMLAGTLATALMGMEIPLPAVPEMIILLALTLGLTARSIYVPSSATRTLVLGASMALPIVGAAYQLYAHPPAAWADEVARWGSEGHPVARAGSTFVWWVLSVTVATSASKVIYGLRKEVRDARQVGQYRLEEKLGEGGMGVVYKARHALLRRPTAVKLLPPDRTGDAIERFEREVQLTASLRHPNTVTIYDYGRTTDGVFYYAMELIDGATLGDIVAASGPQPQARVRALLRQAADALVEAHGIGLVHRDIKPANVMVFQPHQLDGLNEMAKVVDFGLVKKVDAGGAIGTTGAGMITGTPQYMAPESILDPDRVDARADLYALGAVGYFLLAGRHVFEAKTVIEMCSKHLSDVPEPPSAVRGEPIDPDFERLILSCLEKDPAKRPQTAAALRDQLDALANVGDWRAEHARSWWTKHQAALARSHERVVLSVGETLDVRFAHRDTVVAPRA